MIEAIRPKAIAAIRQSIVHRNTTPANQLLNDVRRRKKVRMWLIHFFENFGHFAYSPWDERLLFHDRKLEWTAGYEKQLDGYGRPIAALGRPKEFFRPSTQRARTAFDKATARSTMRASIYAKQLAR